MMPVRVLGLTLVVGAMSTLVFFTWAFCNEPVLDRQTIGFYVACSLPPLGGLAGGLACLTEKKRDA